MFNNAKKLNHTVPIETTPRPAEPYIGCKVSLISMLEIRYEGTLYTLNTEEKTLTLSQVRSYGTEDRPVACPVEATENVYQYVVFKAANVKDLFVVEDSKDKDIGHDPAIVTYKPAFNPQQQSSPPRGNGRSNNESGGIVRFNGGASSFNAQRSIGSGFNSRMNNFNGGGGDRRFNNRDNHFNRNVNPQMFKTGMFNTKGRPGNNIFSSDYDFAKANELFKEKLDTAEDVSDENSSSEIKPYDNVKIELDLLSTKTVSEKEDKGPAYDKNNSFFDNISCETVEKMEGKFRPRDWQTERNLNQQTFGFHGNSYNNGPRGGNMNGSYRFHNNFNSGGFSSYGKSIKPRA
ncbi:hypothetical protein M3Y94_01309300 [Aphelenchoides besseyi]|nr:hypothetical protein M3Y94_01309300 [Aphelenchoides besseyi]KAI6220257.1 hypothetical protein M3Y95_01065800 [Aphelenchoides besseyi]